MVYEFASPQIAVLALNKNQRNATNTRALASPQSWTVAVLSPCISQAGTAAQEASSQAACLSVLSTGMALEDLNVIDLVWILSRRVNTPSPLGACYNTWRPQHLGLLLSVERHLAWFVRKLGRIIFCCHFLYCWGNNTLANSRKPAFYNRNHKSCHWET